MNNVFIFDVDGVLTSIGEGYKIPETLMTWFSNNKNPVVIITGTGDKIWLERPSAHQLIDLKKELDSHGLEFYISAGFALELNSNYQFVGIGDYDIEHFTKLMRQLLQEKKDIIVSSYKTLIPIKNPISEFSMSPDLIENIEVQDRNHMITLVVSLYKNLPDEVQFQAEHYMKEMALQIDLPHGCGMVSGYQGGFEFFIDFFPEIVVERETKKYVTQQLVNKVKSFNEETTLYVIADNFITTIANESSSLQYIEGPDYKMLLGALESNQSIKNIVVVDTGGDEEKVSFLVEKLGSTNNINYSVIGIDHQDLPDYLNSLNT